ncbi:MAG: gfo/Idh/MocA family oxidoreductase, partial [Planctomycetota bacterium]
PAIPVADVPANLDWDRWLGPAPMTDYRFVEGGRRGHTNCHYEFRWWYEYSGGKMTDWGAHHLDIAQWAIDSLPIEIEASARFPSVAGGYNVATDFSAKLTYANGVELRVADEGRRGILFEGDRGKLFVNRAVIAGGPIDRLESDPLHREEFSVYDFDNLSRPERAGKLDAITNHMGNFFDCIEARRTPISPVEDSHRTVSSCHLANIAMRLGRPLKWDPALERFREDTEANQWLQREQRQGFEVV